MKLGVSVKSTSISGCAWPFLAGIGQQALPMKLIPKDADMYYEGNIPLKFRVKSRLSNTRGIQVLEQVQLMLGDDLGRLLNLDEYHWKLEGTWACELDLSIGQQRLECQLDIKHKGHGRRMTRASEGDWTWCSWGL